MVSNKDYYELLGINKNATQEEISTAFRKMSRKYHPDLNKDPKAPEKFSEISKAYETLSNPEKRNAYDQGFGDNGNPFEGFSKGGNGGFGFSNFDGDFGVNMEDIFEFAFGSGSSRKNNRTKGEDIGFMINISLEDAFRGKTVQIEYEKLSGCKTCHGSGSKDGKVHKCEYCNGSGYVSMQSFFGFIRQMCPKCNGTKQSQANTCPGCRGQKRIKINTQVKFDIYKGIQNEETIRIKGAGNDGIEAASGDLVIKVKIDESKSKFKRSGADLHTECKVKISKMVLGGKQEITGVMGDTISFNVPKYSQPNTKIEISGLGMPIHNSYKHGNLYITLIPDMPRNVPDALLNSWNAIYDYENGGSKPTSSGWF